MQRSEIIFKKGSILRKEMLADLYEYPRFAMESYYYLYSDGILYGMEWLESEENKGHHIITPGALKFHGNIYFQTELIDVEKIIRNQCELKLDGKYKLFFCEDNNTYTEPSRTIYKLELKAVQSDGIEDAKKSGFYYSYVEWQGGISGFEVIEDKNEIYGLYAGNDGFAYKLPAAALKSTLLVILEEKNEKCTLDYKFLEDIYTNRGISVSMALIYLKEYYKYTGQAGIYLDETACNPKELLELLVEACKKFQIKNNRKFTDDNVGSNKTENREGIFVHSQGAL